MIYKKLQINPDLGSNAQYFNPFGPNIIHFTLNENIRTLLLNCVNDFRKQTDIKKDLDTKGQIIQGMRASENQKNSIVDGEAYMIPPDWQKEHHANIVADTILEITMEYGVDSAFASAEDLNFRSVPHLKEDILKEVEAFLPEINEAWYVVLKAGDFHILHEHNYAGATFSGSIYLEVPKQLEEQYPQGTMNWLVGAQSGGMYNSHWAITPRPGDVFIWPSWIRHTVYPFRGEGERTMISFNSLIKVKKNE